MLGIRICVFLISLYSVWGEVQNETLNNTITSRLDMRIVGGQIVNNRSDFPHQVSLRIVPENIPFCGASIIDHRNLLTAAHCVVNKNGNVISLSTIQAVIGDLITTVTWPSTVTRKIRHIFIHENFNTTTLQHDIAVLRVDNLTFNSYIHSIPLTLTVPPANTNCIISGWGTIFSGGPPSQSLRYTSVPIVPFGVCNNIYGNILLPGMLCAGYYRADACEGDSGGPLVCNNTLAGIISWGNGCGIPEYPGVYTDIAFYFTWIHVQKDRSISNATLLNKYILFFGIIVYILNKNF